MDLLEGVNQYKSKMELRTMNSKKHSQIVAKKMLPAFELIFWTDWDSYKKQIKDIYDAALIHYGTVDNLGINQIELYDTVCQLGIIKDD